MPAGGDAPPMSDAEVSAIYQSNGFQDIMQKAAAIKGAQLAEKRLEWERAPDYMKETIGAPEDVVSARTLGPEERRAVALAYKARGNDNFSISKHGSAAPRLRRCRCMRNGAGSSPPARTKPCASGVSRSAGASRPACSLASKAPQP